MAGQSDHMRPMRVSGSGHSEQIKDAKIMTRAEVAWLKCQAMLSEGPITVPRDILKRLLETAAKGAVE